MFKLEQFIELVNSASVNPASVTPLSDHRPLKCRFRYEEDMYHVMTWNILSESAVCYLTGDFGENPVPSWWSLDSQMGLENNVGFKREHYTKRRLKIQEFIYQFLNDQDNRDDYMICCLQECWWDVYFCLVMFLQPRGFTIHRTHEDGKKYFNVVIVRHGRSNKSVAFHYSVQSGLALQYFSIRNLAFFNLHGSFNGGKNVDAIERALECGLHNDSAFVLIGDTNMQVRPLSSFAVNDGGMQMDTFMNTISKIFTHKMSKWLYLTMSPDRYTNFSPLKNVDQHENSDHQDVIAFFLPDMIGEQKYFMHYATECPEINFNA